MPVHSGAIHESAAAFVTTLVRPQMRVHTFGAVRTVTRHVREQGLLRILPIISRIIAPTFFHFRTCGQCVAKVALHDLDPYVVGSLPPEAQMMEHHRLHRFASTP